MYRPSLCIFSALGLTSQDCLTGGIFKNNFLFFKLKKLWNSLPIFNLVHLIGSVKFENIYQWVWMVRTVIFEIFLFIGNFELYCNGFWSVKNRTGHCKGFETNKYIYLKHIHIYIFLIKQVRDSQCRNPFWKPVFGSKISCLVLKSHFDV